MVHQKIESTFNWGKNSKFLFWTTIIEANSNGSNNNLMEATFFNPTIIEITFNQDNSKSNQFLIGQQLIETTFNRTTISIFNWVTINRDNF